MIEMLSLINFRGFKEYTLRDLSRVNLIVGKNNCGKTSVLEGACLLCSGGNPNFFVQIASIRGEFVSALEEQPRSAWMNYPDISHFFFGHSIELGSHFQIIANDQFLLASIDEARNDQLPLDTVDSRNDVMSRRDVLLRVQHSLPDAGSASVHWISPEGALLDWGNRYPRPRSDRKSKYSHPPIEFITAHSLSDDRLRQLWDKVIIEARELEVSEALRIIEPRLVDVQFLSGEGFRRSSVVIGTKGSPRRIPLGSQGDGLKRLLALAASLVNTEGGVLLVDEIDTGLHYSVMSEMWELVVKTAIKSNIQIFATTHSLDCIRGLATLCESHPEFASEIRLHKIEPQLEESVGLSADQILIAEELDIEVR